VENEDEMKQALLSLEQNKADYAQMRTFVRNLFFTHQDTHTCERVYEFVFGRS